MITTTSGNEMRQIVSGKPKKINITAATSTTNCMKIYEKQNKFKRRKYCSRLLMDLLLKKIPPEKDTIQMRRTQTTLRIV